VTPHQMLVVDDDPAILEVLQMRLEALGFSVTATPDPRVALQVLGRHRFDVALFDLRMEPLDGIALTRAAHEQQARLPVLIMTAHGTIENAVHAMKQGAFDFLTKPFVPEELRRKIARAIAERRWARDRDLLRTLGEALASTGSMDRTLESIAHTSMEATETERALVFLVDEDGPTLRASAGAPRPVDEPLRQAGIEAMRTGAPVRFDETGERKILAAPLLVAGVPHGALVVENPHWVVPTEDDLELLALFAAHAAVALKNANELSRLKSGALAALGRVATQVAHDLNNPLNGLKLHSYLLAERLDGVGDGEGVQLAERMGRTIDQMAEMVGDILAFGRPRQLQRQPVRLASLVEECVALVEDRLIQQGVELEMDLDEVDGPHLLDGSELRRVFLNLMLNALDAMEQGGRLSIQGRKVGDALAIVVQDDGCGMDEETRSRALDLFFSTKAKGTGLGMSIVRSVIERHGGQLEIESAPDEGTCIKFTLPIAAEGNA
jgi:signal transduction histidine kinase